MKLQPVLVRVDVQEGEVALAQRDEVALGAEVVVQLDGRAVAGDLERELLTGRETHVEPVRLGRGGRRGERLRASGAVDGQVRREGARLAGGREVGVHAVGAGVGEGDGHGPAAVGALDRVDVLEAGQVAAHDDHVHALGVLDVEVLDGVPVAVGDAEGELEGLVCVRRGAGELERIAVLGDGQAADGLRRHRLHAVGGVLVVRGLAGTDVHAAAGERRAAEGEHEDRGEAGQAGGDAHASSAS